MPEPGSIIVAPATSSEDLAAIKHLFSSYVASLPIDIAYQNFTHELATLPGKYSPPSRGALFIARSTTSGDALGCVALRSIDPPGCCEMKRLFVTSEGRGLGLGRILLKKAIEAAEDLGFEEIRLDTLPTMGPARALYKEFGFQEIAAYYPTPIQGTIFLGLTLRNAT